ncbi:molybdopterin molybdotransferase MoeA [Demequina aurantiaca]|uniref:molybdopterin molybdotransferase MoeA n=1 Tax=Demequina aurantiaca TaxID=676200 RepID=UPI00078450D3|nr:gephyrin-like molybdotransferase Glp [Demequina aurantiaca]
MILSSDAEPRTLVQHRAEVIAGLRPLPPLDVLVADAIGATLVGDVVAQHALPATDVAMCDGYAVQAADIADASDENPVSLTVSHDVSFDARAPRRHIRGAAARISSGAPVPIGADAVVPVAMTDGGVARVKIMAPTHPQAHIRSAGDEAASGSMAIPQGSRLDARRIALAAALGNARLTVSPVPRVVVISVGSELEEPGAGRPGSRVPESNAYMLSALVREAGAHAYRVGVVPDDRGSVRATIEDQLVRADVVLITGGLSEARNDTVAAVLKDLGDVRVGEVGLWPGKRHGYGLVSADGEHPIPVLALPGSPTAALIAFEAYVRPALRFMSGRTEVDRPTIHARSIASWRSLDGQVQPVPVTIETTGSGQHFATPVGIPGEISLTNVVASDALAWVDSDVANVTRGDSLRCTLWD